MIFRLGHVLQVSGTVRTESKPRPTWRAHVRVSWRQLGNLLSWCNRSQKLQGRGRILLTCRRPHRVVRERASVSGWRRVTTEAGGAGATHPSRPWRILAAPHHPAATPFCVAIEGDAHSPKAH